MDNDVEKHIELVELTEADAEFIYNLVTQHSFIENIGDKGVTDLESAKQHLQERYITPYREIGYGLWGIRDNRTSCIVGVCGLVTRPGFEIPDIGYSLLDEFCGNGYVATAAKKTLEFAKKHTNFSKINAITSPENKRSQKVLEKLGFEFVKEFQLEGYDGISILYQRAL